jgi:hypothetical protein
MRFMLRSLIAPLRPHLDQVRRLERAAQPDPACLTDAALAQVADGGGTPAQREHLAGCPLCRAHLVELHALLADGAVARELARLAPRDRATDRRRTRWTIVAGAAAAAVLALVFVPPLVRNAGVDPLRDHPGVERGAVPLLVSPRGEVTARPEFRWSPVPEATQYRITVFDVEGGLVWSVETADSSAALPPDAAMTPGTSYWWRVEARVDFDRWVASDLANFTPR